MDWILGMHMAGTHDFYFGMVPVYWISMQVVHSNAYNMSFSRLEFCCCNALLCVAWMRMPMPLIQHKPFKEPS